MSDWEAEINQQVQSEGIPPVTRQPSRLGAKARRNETGAGAGGAAGGGLAPLQRTPSTGMPESLRQLSRPGLPQRPGSLAPQRRSRDDDDDPFAVHSQPQQQPQQQPFVHPLMAEPLRGPSQAQRDRDQQQQQQYYSQPSASDMQRERDPEMRRIESTLRNTLGSTGGGGQQLPPLGAGRPVVPPLKLGEVINKVLGPRALTNPSGAPALTAAQEAQRDQELRGLVRQKKLHESVNPAVASSAAVAAMDAAELQRVGAFLDDGGAPLDYDENDEDDPAHPHHNDGMAERRPLSPKKDLPISRLPIDRDDLARRPEDLVDAAAQRREELMHFRINQQYASNAAAAAGAPVGATSGGGALAPSVSNTMGGPALDQSRGRLSLGASLRNALGGATSPTNASATTAAAVDPRAAPAPPMQESYVESKTTGEFIRVRQAPGMDGLGEARGNSGGENKHNIADFDAQIDTIIDSVNGIQTGLSAFWLMVSGVLVGACLLQVYLIYLKESHWDFLSYYSVFAGPARKVIYVLLGFSATLACWRYSLERWDPDRHAHFISRYHYPNAAWSIWGRNLFCAVILLVAFLLTLVMVPLEDYMENQYRLNKNWFVGLSELPQYFTDRIGSWYACAMVRLIFVSLGWLCMIHRFGGAEAKFLELEQEKAEKRGVMAAGTMAIAAAQAQAAASRTSKNGAGGAMSLADSGRGMGTARSSRVSSSQRLGATGNGGAGRMDVQQGVQMGTMRR